jgi:tetratricopeptide (TPR) repeat protein
MMKILIVICLLIPIFGKSQLNCNVYQKDAPCYSACLLVNEAERAQGSRESQLQFDSAIQLCPSLDYAYFEKAVPYLKRGDFITWKELIDRAVVLNPGAHLGYRGWCRYQFVRDYHGAIADFEKLDSMITYDLGYSINGDYHLNFAKALCYKAIGRKNEALKIMEDQLAKEGYSPMTYDYLHIGVLKMEIGDDEGAIYYLKKSIEYNDYLAEPYFYLGLIYKARNQQKAARDNMEKAKAYYQKGYRRSDPYTHPIDKIFLADIERELKSNP